MTSSRPRLLDLFCGAGGASVGYHRAGFDVVGVDIRPQPDYPFEFHRADALEFPLDGFDAVHASPPCQAFSRAKHLRAAQGGKASSPDLVMPVRVRLVASWLPHVIENVPGAPIRNDVTLCGSMFGLAVRRHRVFEVVGTILDKPPACRHKEQGRPVGVYHVMGDEIPKGGRTAKSLAEGQAAMGIDWMRWQELKEAIPPAYTEWIGRRLLDAVKRRTLLDQR